eukprot:3674842-Prymnesium_polylepis.1
MADAAVSSAANPRPTVHFTLPARAGKLDGWVPGLALGTTYKLAVRAHRFGCAEDAGNGTWSELTWMAGSCRTLDEPATVEDAVPASVNVNGVATRWLEVFRVTEVGRTLPDFLDNHDSGDMGGDGAILSMILGAPGPGLFGSGLITRYCVEMLNTTVVSSTTTFAGVPIDSPFADYRSTNPPWLLAAQFPQILSSGEVTIGAEYASWCDLVPDRYWGHLSRKSMLAAKCDFNATSKTGYLCYCSDASAAASRRFIGATSIGLPGEMPSRNDARTTGARTFAPCLLDHSLLLCLAVFGNPVVPGVYPASLSEPVGHWFSHPVGGRCPLGARVGAGGCTWQREPISHSVTYEELEALGWNASWAWFDPKSPNGHQPLEQTQFNMAVFRKAWQVKGLAPCGQKA